MLIPPMPPSRAHGMKDLTRDKWPCQHVPSAQVESLRPQPIVCQPGAHDDGRGIGSVGDFLQQFSPRAWP